jgi:hypothetical protein
MIIFDKIHIFNEKDKTFLCKKNIFFVKIICFFYKN